MEDVVGGVDGHDAGDRVAASDDEFPDRDADVHDPEKRRVLPGEVADGEQPEDPGRQVDDVVPAIDRQDPEDLDGRVVPEDVTAGAEVRVVEEADDPGDREHGAHDAAVELRWTGLVHVTSCSICATK